MENKTEVQMQGRREANKRWRQSHPNYQKDYVERNRESVRKMKREYREKNPEARRYSSLKWSQKSLEYRKEKYYKSRIKAMLYQAKLRADKRGLPFNIDASDIVIPSVCPVLGIEIAHRASGFFNPNSPSLDRIVSELGYVKGNVRVISNRANILKRDATLQELLLVAAYVARETGHAAS